MSLSAEDKAALGTIGNYCSDRDCPCGGEAATAPLIAAVELIVARHTAAAVAAFKAEAADELTVEAMRHSGIAHSLCDAYMRAAAIVRNLT